MKIKLLKDLRIAGEHCEKGSVVETSDTDAKYLIAAGDAKSADKEAKAKKQTVKKVSVVILKSVLVAGKHYDKGDSVSALETDASTLIKLGLALDKASDEAKDFLAAVKKEKAAAEKAAAEEG